MRLHKTMLFVFLLFVFANCHKQEIAIANKPVDEHKVQQWLHKYGGIYANETINVQTATGTVYTGKLNWNSARQYSWRGKDYLDVPFVFNGNTSVLRNASTAEASFVLVVRKTNDGGFEGAIRTETHSPDLLQEKGLSGFRKKSLMVQSYTTLNGDKANVWISDNSYRFPEAVIMKEANSSINAAVRSMGASATSAKIRDLLMNSSARAGNSISVANANTLAGSSAGNTAGDTPPAADNIITTLPDACGFTITTTSYGFDCIYASEEDRRSMTVTCVWTPLVIMMGGGTCITIPYYDIGNTDNPGSGNKQGNGSSSGSSGDILYPPAQGDDGVLGGDPCEKARKGSQKATDISKSEGYKDALEKITKAAEKDNIEHAATLNEDANGNIIPPTTISNGGETSTSTSINDNTYATIHNHTDGRPPSPGDIYGLIKANLGLINGSPLPNFTTKFVTLGANAPVYALIVTDPEAAKSFVLNHPEYEAQGSQPGFPDDINDEWNEIFNVYGYSEEIAAAYILDQYDAGVALLKQNSDGTFSKLGAVKTEIGDGKDPTYTEIKCPN